MIRVVLRHLDDAEGALVGDFRPDQIDSLLNQLSSTSIYMGDRDDIRLADDSTQWVVTDEARPRVVLEVLVTDPAFEAAS